MEPITLETLCQALQDARTDAKIWVEAGYIWIKTDSQTLRISIDKVRR